MQKPRLSVFPSHELAHAASSGTPSSPMGATSGPRAVNLKISPETSAKRVNHELDRAAGTLEPRSVTVRLATIVPLLLDAVEHNRTWLSDFSDDTVRLDADLFEVLLAYQELREEAAA